MHNDESGSECECEIRYKKLLEDAGESYDKNELLVQLVKGDHLDIVKCVVEHQGADVNYDGTIFGNSVLQIAASNGRAEVVKYLVSKGADIDRIGTIFKDNALCVAVEGGHIETAKTLIELGAETENPKWDLFSLAIKSKNKEMIEFVARQVHGIQESDDNKRASITLVKVSQHPEVSNASIDYLLKQGADINYKDESGMTALAYAVQNGDYLIADSLIEMGAKTDIEVDGKDLLMLAADFDRCIPYGKDEYYLRDMVPLVSTYVLGERGKCRDLHDQRASKALYRAASLGIEWRVGQFLSELITIGADIDYKSADGSTPLIAATRNGHNAVVEELIKLGANVEVELEGQNLMDLAIEIEDFDSICILAERGIETKQADAKQFAYSKDIREPEIFVSVHAVKWLVSKGANVDVGIEENDTALFRAVESKRIEMARTLIELGARTDIVRDGKNLLDIAIDNRWDQTTMIELLLDAGLKCDKRDSTDELLNSSLRSAAFELNVRVVRYLVSIGADLQGCNEDILVRPVRLGSIEMVSVLTELGARTDIVKNGDNLLDMAINLDSVEMVKLVLKHGSFDINGLDPSGQPYLSVAIECDSQKVVKYLLDEGVDCWLRSEPDAKSLLWFCTHEFDEFNLFDDDERMREIMITLLDHVEKREGKEALNRYINLRDARGQTALHFYSQRGDDKSVKLLLSLGADPEIQDSNHKRALDLAKNDETKNVFASYCKSPKTE